MLSGLDFAVFLLRLSLKFALPTIKKHLNARNVRYCAENKESFNFLLHIHNYLSLKVSGRQTKFFILSKIEAIDEAVVRTVKFATEAGFGDDALFGIDVAVREAVANAVRHGNKLDETKRVEITLNDLSEGLEILIRDFGEGFVVEDVPDPTDPENLLKSSGRGILFMHNFVDFVEWKRHAEGGMIVKMIKNR